MKSATCFSSFSSSMELNASWSISSDRFVVLEHPIASSSNKSRPQRNDDLDFIGTFFQIKSLIVSITPYGPCRRAAQPMGSVAKATGCITLCGRSISESLNAECETSCARGTQPHRPAVLASTSDCRLVTSCVKWY